MIAVTLLLGAIAWVAVRGVGAVAELQHVATFSSRMKSAISEGDVKAADRLSARVAHHARSAHELTSDPVWRAFGIVPWLGPNFTAVSDIAEIADDVANDALEPLIDAAGGLDLAGFGLVDGAIDLAPFAEIEQPLAAASATLSDAESRALRIDADATLPPLAEKVREMREVVTQAATVVGTLHGASALLPGMLGAAGPRDYVIAMQNNSELRSSGGIIGAIALLHAEGGVISLARQAATSDFPPLDEPLPLSDSTVALFGDGPGVHLQNITSIPDFTEAGPTIAERWTDRFGGTVDGVIAVDTVVTAHLLGATGPLAFGPFTVDEDNVVRTLLSDVYATVPDPLVQDSIFAQAASTLLGAALSGADPKALIGALAESADEGRVRIWSAHPEEQRLLAKSTLAGSLPHDGDRPSVGVLINDTTGGKLDFYAKAAIATAVGVCHGEQTTQVRVTWTNGAPADAATSLSEYVTGGGHYGVPPGSTRTLVTVYGPEEATPSHIDRDGAERPVQTAMLGTRSAVQHEVILAPGESTTITVEFSGTGAGARGTAVRHTPMVTGPDIDRKTLHCTS